MQSTKELSTREVTELTVKLMKDIQDRIAKMKQMKTQPDSIRKPRIIDHNELIATPIKDNIDGDILVVENPPATPKPNVDTDVHASTSVALTSVQGNESIEEQQGEKMVPKESIMLEGAHDVKVKVVECASDQPSTVLEDLHLGEVKRLKPQCFLWFIRFKKRLYRFHTLILLFQIRLMWWNSRFFFYLCFLR